MNELNKMGEFHKQKIIDTVSAFSNEEMEVAVQSIPSDYMYAELKRRNTVQANALNAISHIMNDVREQNI